MSYEEAMEYRNRRLEHRKQRLKHRNNRMQPLRVKTEAVPQNYFPLVEADTDILRAVASAPYADCRELVAFVEASVEATAESMERLHNNRLIRYVWYNNDERWWVRRWFITGWGLAYLTLLDDSALDLVVMDHPVSLYWRYRLVQRLDQVRSFYQVAQHAAASVERPVVWNWYGVGPAQALISFGNKRQLGLLMCGQTQTPAELGRVVSRIAQLQIEDGYPDMLLIMPGEIQAERLLCDNSAEPVRMHVVSDDDLYQSHYRRQIWKSYGNYDRALSEVIQDDDGGRIRIPVNYGNIDDAISSELLERDTPAEALPSEHPGLLFPSHLLLATEISAGERLLLQLIYEWPLLRAESAQSLSGLSYVDTDRMLLGLEDKRLVQQVQVGGDGEPERYCLGFAGIRRIGGLEGVRNDSLLQKFRVDPGWEPEQGDQDDAAMGTEIRYVLDNKREIDRTIDVIVMLRRDIWTAEGMHLAQAAPWHLWNRLIRGNREMFSPYATVKLADEERAHHLFIEVDAGVEVWPLLRRRLENYCRYLDSEAAARDFDGQPAFMLVVLQDRSWLKEFAEEMRELSRKPVPIFAAGWDVLEAEGMNAKAWRCPWEWYLNARSLDEVLADGLSFTTALGRQASPVL